MRFRQLAIDGVYEIIPEPASDERGFFARTWCASEFAEHGLPTQFVQTSISQNTHRGTLRGLHFQHPPSFEGKIVRCERGSICDVVLDLRADSPGFLKHIAVNLCSRTANALYVPPGLAHGFQTLEDDTRVYYMMTDEYAPNLAGGVRWDDPAFGIDWPLDVRNISDRDNQYPDFDAARDALHFPEQRDAR